MMLTMMMMMMIMMFRVPLYVNKLDEALRLAENGQKIFIEAGEYTVSAGEGKGPSSYYVFGKNLSLIGASTKDCVLLYKKAGGISYKENVYLDMNA